MKSNTFINLFLCLVLFVCAPITSCDSKSGNKYDHKDSHEKKLKEVMIDEGWSLLGTPMVFDAYVNYEEIATVNKKYYPDWTLWVKDIAGELCYTITAYPLDSEANFSDIRYPVVRESPKVFTVANGTEYIFNATTINGWYLKL